MNNKEKLLKLVSDEQSPALAQIRERIKNREMLHESQQIAIKVLMRLHVLGWTKKQLAEAMDVRPQQISKIVSGRENMTIGTLVRLQQILDIPLLASYVENRPVRPDEVLFEMEQ